MFQPVLRRHVREAVEFRAAVVLVEDRSPPVEHLLLHLLRTRRRGVDRDLVRRQVEAAAFRLGHLQHAREHRRHPLARGDAIVLDGLQREQRIELRHHHDGAAERLRAGREAERCRVIHRRRRQIHGVESKFHSCFCSAPSGPASSLIFVVGNGRRMPFGRPVVPELYSMNAPDGSSSSGRAGIRRDRFLVVLESGERCRRPSARFCSASTLPADRRRCRRDGATRPAPSLRSCRGCTSLRRWSDND